MYVCTNKKQIRETPDKSSFIIYANLKRKNVKTKYIFISLILGFLIFVAVYIYRMISNAKLIKFSLGKVTSPDLVRIIKDIKKIDIDNIDDIIKYTEEIETAIRALNSIEIITEVRVENYSNMNYQLNQSYAELHTKDGTKLLARQAEPIPNKIKVGKGTTAIIPIKLKVFTAELFTVVTQSELILDLIRGIDIEKYFSVKGFVAVAPLNYKVKFDTTQTIVRQ